MRRPQQRAVERVGPGVVRAAQRPGRRAAPARPRAAPEQLRAAVPADVVRRVQRAVRVAGDQHRLPHDVHHRDPAGLVQPEVGQPADAEPLAEQHPSRSRANAVGSTYISRGSAACSRLVIGVPHDGPSRVRHQVAGALVPLARRAAPRAALCGRRPRHRRPPPPVASAGHRGWNRQPARDPGRVRDLARPARSARAARSRVRRTAAPACRGAAAAASTSSVGPASTIRPRYITAIRSAMFQARPRSWVTTSTPEPELVAQLEQQRQDLAADRGVQAGHRLVGDQQVRARARARRRSARAAAARRTARAGSAGTAAPAAAARPRPARRRPAAPRCARRGRRSTSPCSRSPSATES